MQVDSLLPYNSAGEKLVVGFCIYFFFPYLVPDALRLSCWSGQPNSVCEFGSFQLYFPVFLYACVLPCLCTYLCM